MVIKTTAATPVPNEHALEPKFWASGPWQEVIEGKFRAGPTTDQHDCLYQTKDGGVLVSFDVKGRVKTMDLLVKNRFVSMQDGFATDHIRILLGNIGEEGRRRDAASAFGEMVAKMKTCEEVTAEQEVGSADDLGPEWHQQNSRTLDTLIWMARTDRGDEVKTAPEPESDTGPRF